MSGVNSLASIASLVAEPSRTVMLVTLMDGRALTSGELARAAGVTPQTASGHLTRLGDGGLVHVEQRGRRRYYKLAGAEVAAILEGLMSLDATLAAQGSSRVRIVTGPRDDAMRRARMCYNHLAGQIAVSITDAMIGRGELEFGDDGGQLTDRGLSLIAALGGSIQPGDLSRRRKMFCRPCMDWSERRPHIAGAVGVALCRAFVERGWVTRVKGSRAMAVSSSGAVAFDHLIGSMSPTEVFANPR